jgi:single-stranded-DNA-specific exonuclease
MTSSQKTSILGFNWQQKDHDERLAMAIRQKLELSDALAKIIAAKDISLDEVESFLDPKIKTHLPDPFQLLDMREAVTHTFEAIKQNKRITIFADYDVDGATSSALLKRFFREIGVNVGIYVPDRAAEGYGPNTSALLKLKESGTDLVITVDCGTVAFEPLEEAAKAGLDIIVIDHHIGVTQKPQALAVINPNRIDENFPHKNICAAGVSFLFAVAVNKFLRENGFYSSQNIKEPNLLKLLDLVALGTVCDVMPLVGLNRAFVAQGLKIIKNRTNLGIKTICDLAGLDEEPSAYHLGFVIGPRINAGGRVGKSDLGARLLSSEDESETQEVAAQLEEFNKQRKDIETQIQEEAQGNLEKSVGGFSTSDSIIFAVSDSWHQGVIGIVASRLKDLYNKPVAVIAVKDGKGKASCRSINGVDFGSAILKARLEGLLIEGGGHAMAGGFSVEESKITDLHKFFNEILQEKVAEFSSQKDMFFAAQLDLPQVNIDLLKELSKLEPFGMGNAKPKFIIRDLQKVKANLIGKTQEHISCVFSYKTALGFSGNLQAVSFRSANTPLAEILLDPKYTKPMNVAGQLNINSWMGVEKVQLLIEDILI